MKKFRQCQLEWRNELLLFAKCNGVAVRAKKIRFDRFI